MLSPKVPTNKSSKRLLDSKMMEKFSSAKFSRAAHEDQDELEEMDETDSRACDMAYLNTLNESILEASEHARRGQLFDSSRLGHDPNSNPGINARIFSTSNDLSEIIKPKNGVRLKNNRVEIGTGRYKNPNPSKMSLADYNDIAKQH